MATLEQISALRAMIAEPTDAAPYEDATLNAAIDDATGDLNLVAYNIWTNKAASAATLVDISEGGSSRKMSDVYKNALAMASVFGSKVPGGTGEDAPKATRIYRLTR